MVKECNACLEEFYMACKYVKEGLHLATEINTNFDDKHFFAILVNNNGDVVLS